MSTAPITAVHFERVSRRFGAVEALRDVSLEIPAGQTVALLGRNGAGKSTAIGLMLGLLDPSEGEVRTLGLAARDAVRGGRVGAMLQDAALPVGATVDDLVGLARGLSPRPLGRDAILERAALHGLVGRQTQTLSGGEAQRVRFALAIAGDPDLVFLDEPTVAMDVETRRAFWRDMRRSADDGRTILFATHHLDEADQVADRIVILDHGRVIADGTPADLRATVTERTVRFALPHGPVPDLTGMPGVTATDVRGTQVSLTSTDADATIRDLVGAGIAFRHLEVSAPDLETAFLALTGRPMQADTAVERAA